MGAGAVIRCIDRVAQICDRIQECHGVGQSHQSAWVASTMMIYVQAKQYLCRASLTCGLITKHAAADHGIYSCHSLWQAATRLRPSVSQSLSS